MQSFLDSFDFFEVVENVIHQKLDKFANLFQPRLENQKMDAAVYLPQPHSSENAIAYCNVGSTSVVLLEIFLVLHKSKYGVQLNFTPKLHELQLESAVTLF